jgi:hypothetical protein
VTTFDLGDIPVSGHGGSDPVAAYFASLQAAVALITARVAQIDVHQADIVGDVDQGLMIHTLTIVASAFLTTTTSPTTADHFLREMGALAARESAGGDPYAASW